MATTYPLVKDIFRLSGFCPEESWDMILTKLRLKPTRLRDAGCWMLDAG
jgi:hypothetical protein